MGNHKYTTQEVSRILRRLQLNLFAAKKFLSESQRIMTSPEAKRKELLQLSSFKTVEGLAKWVQWNQNKIYHNEKLLYKYQAIYRKLNQEKVVFLNENEYATYLVCLKEVEMGHPDCGCEFEFCDIALQLRRSKHWKSATVKGYIGQLVKKGLIGTFEDSCYDYWIRERDIEEMYGELLKVKIVKDCGVERKKQV